jgi:hypothetical protein
MNSVRALVVVLFLVSPAGAEVRFSASAKSLTPGQTAMLQWEAENAAQVFISGLGKQPARGSAEVKPNATTVYTLVAPGQSEVRTATARVVVETGGRGIDALPEPERFHYSRTGSVALSTTVEFLDRLHRVLQDQMGFSVRTLIEPATKKYVLATNLSQRSELIRPDENRIGGRRLAYLIEFDLTPDARRQLQYVVKTLIESKRRAEQTWRIESIEASEALYREHADKLRSLIAGASR